MSSSVHWGVPAPNSHYCGPAASSTFFFFPFFCRPWIHFNDSHAAQSFMTGDVCKKKKNLTPPIVRRQVHRWLCEDAELTGRGGSVSYFIFLFFCHSFFFFFIPSQLMPENNLETNEKGKKWYFTEEYKERGGFMKPFTWQSLSNFFFFKRQNVGRCERESAAIDPAPWPHVWRSL